MAKARRQLEWGRLENGLMARLRGDAEWMFEIPSLTALDLTQACFMDGAKRSESNRT